MSGQRLSVPTAEVFEPLILPARYKAAFGGRGSGKSHFFAGLMVEYALCAPGFRGLCVRESQKSLQESAKQLIESKIHEFGVERYFNVQEKQIRTPGGGLIVFTGMREHTAESVKSYEGFHVAWAEEAHVLSRSSLTLLRPTIRAAGSELWFSWNPRRKTDPVDSLFRSEQIPTGAVVVEANWDDNPWFPPELEQERKDDFNQRPDQYAHIWEGQYERVTEGAYFAKDLAKARAEKRIGVVPSDPVMRKRAFWDIGARDHTAIWIAQFVGQQILVTDYYEATGQSLAVHLNWLRERGHGTALCVLPHDGAAVNAVTAVKFEDHIREAGFEVEVVRNQGKGAAMKRVEAVRRLFPRIWIDEENCEAGIDALGAYHERKDEVRNVGLGPEHDWACLIGETEVLTRYGTCQIKNLPYTGDIMTSCGFRQYINPRITKKNAQLVEVVFTDGHTVKCTPDHLFLTDKGWRYAENLTKASLIQSSLIRSHNTSTADYTDSGRVKSIFHGAERSFIAPFGRRPLERFRRVAIFITEMMMLRTIWLEIWNASQQATISAKHGGMGQNRNTNRGSISVRQPGKRLLSGMPQKRAVCGISGTHNDPKAGQNGSVDQSSVLSAVSNLMRLLEKTVTRRFIALQPAKQQRIEKDVSRTNTLLTIERVRKLNEHADVWCLTVPKIHNFALANGAIVHNSHGSDAFGLLCVAYENPNEDQNKSSFFESGRSMKNGNWMSA